MTEQALQRLKDNIARVYLGRPESVDLLLVALLARGHVLVEDVPGIGKTTLVKAAARSLNLSFQRIQCTPDLLPGDVTGVTYFDVRDGVFRFRPGPILASLVLVDEVNRATPRTQSALLEAMAEGQVTVDGETHACPQPFLVLATQNPVELEGTFPLPEAQLDRFMLRMRLGYPDAGAEAEMVRRHGGASPLDHLAPVLNQAEVQELQGRAATVHVAAAVLEYLVAVTRFSRTQEGAALGASPRASLALYRASQAAALLQGRDYVLPDDVKALALPVLAHRLILSGPARLRGTTAEALVAAALDQVPAPVEPIRAPGRE